MFVAMRPVSVWLVWAAVWLASCFAMAVVLVLLSHGLLGREALWLVGSVAVGSPLLACVLTNRSWNGLSLAIHLCASAFTSGTAAGFLIGGPQPAEHRGVENDLLWLIAALLTSGWLATKLWRFRVDGWEPPQFAPPPAEDSSEQLHWLVRRTGTDLQRIRRDAIEMRAMGALMVAIGLPLSFTLAAKLLPFSLYQLLGLLLVIVGVAWLASRVLGHRVYAQQIQSARRVVELLRRLEANRSAEDADRS